MTETSQEREVRFVQETMKLAKRLVELEEQGRPTAELCGKMLLLLKEYEGELKTLRNNPHAERKLKELMGYLREALAESKA